jgi:hypothetical protein
MNYTEQLSWLLVLWLRQAVETLTKKVEKLVAEQKKPVLSTTHAHIVRVQGVKGGRALHPRKGCHRSNHCRADATWPHPRADC